MGKPSSRDEDALAEELEIAETTRRNSKSHFFVLQTLESLKKLELDGGEFICSSPDFQCYFKKRYMPLFEEKDAYVKIAFDKADNVTHVCGLLPRLQHEKERQSTKDENLTLSKVPNCLLSRAIAEVSVAPMNNMSRARNVADQDQTSSTQQQAAKAGHVVHRVQAPTAQPQNSKPGNVVHHQGRAASGQHQNSNIVYDPNAASRSLKGLEKQWLDSMQASLVDGEYQILLDLLQHSIVTHGFREKIEHFLSTKKELQPGNSSVVKESFKYLAREFELKEQVISVARVGTSLEQRFRLQPKEIFSTVVELFFCLGYEKEIKGYTTGFIE